MEQEFVGYARHGDGHLSAVGIGPLGWLQQRTPKNCTLETCPATERDYRDPPAERDLSGGSLR